MLGPALVWSRMFSYGKQQGIKALFAVGEALQCRPDLSGIFLGTSPLDAVTRQSFAIYWSRGEGRVRAQHLLYGTRGTPSSGDPQPYDDVFLCPTQSGFTEPGFSGAYTPSNNTAFGVHSPIYNGTAYRVNWRVISCPAMDGSDDPNGSIRYERRKVAGKECDGTEQNGAMSGMPGTGRGYGRHMGLTAHNGNSYSTPTRVTVAVGHRITFSIYAFELTRDLADITVQSGVEVEDINNAIQDSCIAADDALQVGETFLINRSLWKVVSRPGRTFRQLRSKKNVDWLSYELECTDLIGNPEIGIAGRRAVSEAIVSEGLTLDSNQGMIGPSYFPLLKVDFGIVRNVRLTDATEIGIRSQVWNRASGLCNFSCVPTPGRLNSMDRNKVNLSGGTMSRYFDRTSSFTIQLRPAGLQENGTEYAWAPLSEQFCVTGNRPVDQYNYIRLKSATPGRFEYRLVPKSGAEVRQYSPESEVFWDLDASSETVLGADYQTSYGSFRVTATGRQVLVADILQNRELVTRSGEAPTGTYVSTPSAVSRSEWLPSSVSAGRSMGYWTEFLGDPTRFPKETRSGTKQVKVGSKTITLKITCYSESVKKTENWSYFYKWNKMYYWVEQRVEVVSATGSWSNGERFDHIFDKPDNDYIGVPFGARYSITGMTTTYVPPNPLNSQRIFEYVSRIADVSFYAELEKSNASASEHQIVYVNESISNASVPNYDGMTMLGLALKSGRNYQQLDQLRAWVPDGVPVYHCLDGSTGPSNLFCDLAYQLLANPVMGLGSIVHKDLIDMEGMQRAARFLTANRIHFDGVIADPGNVRSLLVELAPLNLCNFVVAGGRFSVVPALPCNSDGTFNTGPVPVQQIFTSGNIVDGSFQLDYLAAEERRDFKAVMQYRRGPKNQLAQERTVTVRWREAEASAHPQETFDMTLFCTHREQALLVAKYLLSLRRRSTHSVRFKTTPHGMSLAPGQLIRVDTQSSPYSAVSNAVIDPQTGAVLCATPVADGTHEVLAYRPGSDQVDTVSVTVENGRVSDESQRGMLFTRMAASRDRNVYLIEELTLDDDGLVEVSATHFPTDNGLSSLVLQDMLSSDRFEVFD